MQVEPREEKVKGKGGEITEETGEKRQNKFRQEED